MQNSIKLNQQLIDHWQYKFLYTEALFKLSDNRLHFRLTFIALESTSTRVEAKDINNIKFGHWNAQPDSGKI